MTPAALKVFRDGFAPGLSDDALTALSGALRFGDERLIQGATTQPPPLACVMDWPCEGGCLISFAGMAGEGLETVGDVESYFAKSCFDADKRLGEPGGCRWFLNWFDETPRDRCFPELLAVVDEIIAERITARVNADPAAVVELAEQVGF